MSIQAKTIGAGRPKIGKTRRHSWFGKPLDRGDEKTTETTGLRHAKSTGSQDNTARGNLTLRKFASADKSKETENSQTEAGENVEADTDFANLFTEMSVKEENNNSLFTVEKGRLMKKENQDKRTATNVTKTKQAAFIPKGHSSLCTRFDSNGSESEPLGAPTNSQNNKLDEEPDSKVTMASAQVKRSLFGSQESRSTQRRATVHYSSSGRPSVMNIKGMDYNRRTAYSSLQEDEVCVLEAIKDVCRDYIVYRLGQKNLVNRVSIKRKQSKHRWLSREIIFLEKEFERLYENRFADISKQVGITLKSEDILRKLFFDLSEEILTTEKKTKHTTNKENPKKRRTFMPAFSSSASLYVEISWGRLLALIAVAGGLAVDCVQQGHPDLVHYLIEYIGELSRLEGILSWIIDQGGWKAVKELTSEGRASTPNSGPCYFTQLTNIALAFVLCTFGVVLGAVVIGGMVKKEGI